MLYPAYEAQRALLTPWRLAAGLTRTALGSLPLGCAASPPATYVAAWCEMAMHSGLTHERPDWDIDQVTVGRRSVAVREETVVGTPFGKLIHFAKRARLEEPRVLIVAALAGHFSTLLRDTVRTMLADHDVYVAEWSNARDVPAEAGPFGFDDYIAHLVDFLEELGPGTHLVAVCQPCPASISAAAILAERGSSCVPRSLTLMAGPVDTSSNPTAVNELAVETPLSWFADNLVAKVPLGYAGFGRDVYPGFLQVTAFASMNLGRHLDQHRAMFQYLVQGDQQSFQSIRSFYDEYFAVLDMPAEFYLQTIDVIFQRNLLAHGELQWRGQRVNPAAVTNSALLTVEGERDDVCGLGQTLAAHELLSGIEPSNKRHHLQVGVGHYGVFSGRRWQQEIYPVVRESILLHA